jgi:hypothetical protein
MAEAQRLLSNGPFEFYLTSIVEANEHMMSRFASFKTDDRVMLTHAPDTNNAWSSSAHFLVPGAAGIVRDVDCTKRGFFADVEFDEESWLDGAIRRHATNKHTYRLHESLLVRIAAAQIGAAP